MKIKFKSLFAIIKREIAIIVSDKDLLTIILLSPLFYAFFYGTVYLNKSENNVPLMVVDNDRSSISRSLIRAVDAHQLSATIQSATLDEAERALQKGEVQGILFIPGNFCDDLKSGRAGDLKLYINTSRFLPANDLNKALTEVTGTMGAAVRLKFYQTKGLGFEQALEITEPLQAEVKPLFNPSEAYGDFLIPGLLVLIIQQTLLIGLAESMAREREKDSLHGLYKLSHGSLWAVISGKSLFYYVLYASYALLFFTLHFELFNIPLKGRISALALLTLLLLASVIYISLFISSFFKRKIIALQFFVFTSYPVFLLSGYSWPLSAMPLPLQYLSEIIPSTPYFQAFIRITLMGAEWQHVWPEALQLGALTLIGLFGTRIRMRSLLRADLGLPLESPLRKWMHKIMQAG